MNDESKQSAYSRWWALLSVQLLRLYPAAWRERYQTEVRLLLVDHKAGVWTAIDVGLGAIDAHLHRGLLPERIMCMAHRIRNSEIALFCAYIVFLVPWLAFQRIPDPLPTWQADVARFPSLAPLFAVQQAAGYVAFLAILAGGLPILFSVLQQAVTGRRREILLPLGAAAALVIVYTAITTGIFLETSSRPGTGIRPLRPIDVAFTAIWLAASLLGAVLGPYLVAVAVARSELGTSLLRLALVPAAVVTLAIVVGTAAMVALTAISALRAPDLYNPDVSPVALLLMMVGAVLALISLGRGIYAQFDSPAQAV